ncbi:MAG: hypothetical protein F4X93_03655 [Proteobacteria bacterium]|nr:hypothetical protein [Pseudomonadota bacterium]
MKKPAAPKSRKEYLRRRERRALIEGILILLISALCALLALAVLVLGAYFAVKGLWALFQ